MSDNTPWQPTMYLRFEEALDTSMGTARIVTDAGAVYIKALGNRQGPHPLACEWVATHLADWFGLAILECALMTIDAGVDEIPFLRGGNAASGTAFVTHAIQGHTWGGTAEELAKLANPDAVSRLVIFDTWTRNCDRHPPDLTQRRPNYDNVFLTDLTDADSGRQKLMAIDHTHCFTCGRDLDDKIANVAWVKDDRLYGMFPGFVPHVRQTDVEAGIARLRELKESFVAGIVATIPRDWEVEDTARKALTELICRRAEFVADIVLAQIARIAWPGRLFGNGN
jgi:hypothetical protein